LRQYFIIAPPFQLRKCRTDRSVRGDSWRPSAQTGWVRAMRGSSVHATWPRIDSGRSWSFSSINSVVPRSRLPFPQAARDAERRTGVPGVALLAGVRGENSPHLLGNIEEEKSKK